MTFISLAELERRRAEGTSPKGGRAPDFSEIASAPRLDPQARLDALLALQWDHPGDQCLMGTITQLVGRHAPATILNAADCVHERSAGRQPRSSSERDYDTLISSLNPR